MEKVCESLATERERRWKGSVFVLGRDDDKKVVSAVMVPVTAAGDSTSTELKGVELPGCDDAGGRAGRDRGGNCKVAKYPSTATCCKAPGDSSSKDKVGRGLQGGCLSDGA